MAGVKYYNGDNNGGWRDFENFPTIIKKYNGTTWVDGTSSLSPKIFKWDGEKQIQLYPRVQGLATKTWVGSNLCYTNNKNGSTWLKGEAKGGSWDVYNTYTGWLGIAGTGWTGGTAETIENVECTYTRHGVGYWEKGLKIPLCLSVLASPTGSYLSAHNTKGGVFYSDTEMAVVSKSDGYVSGTTTFNNALAKRRLLDFLNSGKKLVVGYDNTGGDYVSISAFSISITYTYPTTYALFPKENNIELFNKVRSGSNEEQIISLTEENEFLGLYLYEDELDMTFEQIVEHRLKNNIPSVELKDNL